MKLVLKFVLSVGLLCVVINGSLGAMKRTESFICIDIEQEFDTSVKSPCELVDSKGLCEILQKFTVFERSNSSDSERGKLLQVVAEELNAFCKKNCTERWNFWLHSFEKNIKALNLENEFINELQAVLLDIETFDILYLHPSRACMYYLNLNRPKSSGEASENKPIKGKYLEAFLVGDIYKDDE